MTSASHSEDRKVLLIGGQPLADELRRLCETAGWTVVFCSMDDLASDDTIDRLRADAENASIAIDLIAESIRIKQMAVSAFEVALPRDAVLITSALSTSTTQVATWLRRPESVVGFGALPPLAQGSVVELAGGLRTDATALEQARAFFDSIDVETAVVKDNVGLVLPRIVCGLINEAARALAEGVADANGIDAAMKLGTRYPHGPLEWGDMIGLDVVLAVMQGLQEDLGEERYQPAPLLRQYVRAGWLGKKSGRGFYEYE